jgi:hypothetical protein
MNPFRKALQQTVAQFAYNLAGAAFDAMQKTGAKDFAMQSEPAPDPAGSATMPVDAHLSLRKCSTCDGPLFWMICIDPEQPGLPVLYWCPNPACHTKFRETKRAAANTEGVPL